MLRYLLRISLVEDKQPKLLISRLGNALKDVSSSNRVPPSQKIKESKLLKDLEKQQKSYGTIQQQDILPKEDILPQKPKKLTIGQRLKKALMG